MDIKNFYNQKKISILIGIILSVIFVLVFGSIVFPTIFYDQFIWRYFWGPIVSDSLGHNVYYNGIKAEEKFTIISELIYGFLIVLVLYGLYKLLKKWNVSVNWFFCLSIMPYIITGFLTRVLEDAEFFVEPFVYFFVTPIIYFQILFWFLIFLLLGYFIQEKFKNKILKLNLILFLGGMLFLIPFLYFTVKWIIQNYRINDFFIGLNVFLLVISLVLLITLSVYSFSKIFKKNKNFVIFSEPLNLAMIAGHMIDGITSYISIYDPLNMGLPPYYEKHPASDFIMNIWPPLFPIIKFILIICVIYLFDIAYKKEFKDYPRLVNLLKIGIFILGFAPGMRDLLRVVLGV